MVDIKRKGVVIMENKIDVKGFIQVCIVVEDIEKALDHWTALSKDRKFR